MISGEKNKNCALFNATCMVADNRYNSPYLKKV